MARKAMKEALPVSVTPEAAGGPQSK
jgi:hypothetical protein